MNTLYTEKFTIYDFIAAGMLAIFTVWLWENIANPIFKNPNSPLLEVLSYVFYLSGAIIITILAFRRKSEKMFLHGLVFGLFMSMSTLVYIFLLVGLNSRFFTIILISFTIGGGLGILVVNRFFLKSIPYSNEQ